MPIAEPIDPGFSMADADRLAGVAALDIAEFHDEAGGEMKQIEARIDLADKAFRKLAKEYASRKAAAEKLVVTWSYSKRSVADFRPLHDEASGWPPGRPMKSKPANLKNVFETGYDAMGRVMVEKQYTESARQFYETFYAWSADLVEVACYGYESEKDAIAMRSAEVVNGRVVAAWIAGRMGFGYDVYHWEAGRCVRIDSFHAHRPSGKRGPLRPFSITKAIYNEAGVLQRVASYSDEDDDDPEIRYELRGETAYWRKR